ncbi:MAG: small basic family protein [Fimbriimonas sp.]
MILLPILALALGFALAFLVRLGPIRGEEAQYLAVACLAGIDSIFGGVRSGIEGKFNTDVFVTGFLANTVIAFGLAWLGDRVLFINLFLAVALILGGRIFTNLSLIRRYLITKWQDAKERKRIQTLSQASTNPEG